MKAKLFVLIVAIFVTFVVSAAQAESQRFYLSNPGIDLWTVESNDPIFRNPVAIGHATGYYPGKGLTASETFVVVNKSGDFYAVGIARPPGERCLKVSGWEGWIARTDPNIDNVYIALLKFTDGSGYYVDAYYTLIRKNDGTVKALLLAGTGNDPENDVRNMMERSEYVPIEGSSGGKIGVLRKRVAFHRAMNMWCQDADLTEEDRVIQVFEDKAESSLYRKRNPLGYGYYAN